MFVFSFSDSNYSRDSFLRDLCEQFLPGGVPISRIARFNRIVSLTEDLSVSKPYDWMGLNHFAVYCR